jgi:serine/threonine-protein kinase PknG
MEELQGAATAVETLTLQGMEHYRLTKQVLETALRLLTARVLTPAASIVLLGQRLEEKQIRLGLEQALRAMAHLAVGNEKLCLVDEANRVRPKTWL